MNQGPTGRIRVLAIADWLGWGDVPWDAIPPDVQRRIEEIAEKRKAARKRTLIHAPEAWRQRFEACERRRGFGRGGMKRATRQAARRQERGAKC